MDFSYSMEGYEIVEIFQGLYRIPIPLNGNPLKELNCYVFKKTEDPESRNLIVDTGFKWDSCYKALIDGLNKLKIDLNKTDIMLTHFHGDHTGNCAKLIRPGTRVFLGQKEYELVVNADKRSGYINSLAEVSKRFEQYGISKETIDLMGGELITELSADDSFGLDFTPLKEGEIVKAGAYELKAVFTPGHTPGHMCYEILGRQSMILGDHVLFDITPNVTAWAASKDSLGDYLKSLDKIDCYDILFPLPGHRHSGDYHERISQLKNHHNKRIRECFDSISSLGNAYLNDIAGSVHWKICASNWNEFPPIQRWFALGECLAHLDYLYVRGKIREYTDESGIKYFKANICPPNAN